MCVLFISLPPRFVEYCLSDMKSGDTTNKNKAVFDSTEFNDVHRASHVKPNSIVLLK